MTIRGNQGHIMGSNERCNHETHVMEDGLTGDKSLRTIMYNGSQQLTEVCARFG